jgi:type IV pilus assembly protein PilB
MKKMVPKQLGELLIEGGVITPEQLKEALAIQKEKSGLIGQILIGLGYATEQAIAQALTLQYGFPYLPLADYEIERDIARTVPEAVARQYSLVAVDRLGKMLTVAMANPLNAEAIDEVERITHLNVQVFVTTQSDVNDAIKRCYKD